ncbi:hypothetical protein NM688_g551 [Phlebia brevispora]|uniref:Uncharacterized protein n=1 Tax=Phlebia brevispora TaxID=194682 RepID=A0ACC1TDT8_9APHY|nr:hypothetical protein NM688_g551 [Phlebia brevispora]
MSLFDFLRTTEIQKLNSELRKRMEKFRNHYFLAYEAETAGDESALEDDDDDENGYQDLDINIPLQFTSSHPHCDTHVVFKLKSSRSFILNFIGGTLPRRDKGDYEEYCRTMLILFAPGGWRSGKELKSADESWEEAFGSTTFSPYALKVMGNMNLLYECLDARDDFAAHRKAEERAHWLNERLGCDLVNALDLENNSMSETFSDDDEEVLRLLEQSSKIIGRESGLIRKKMSEMHHFMLQLCTSTSSGNRTSSTDFVDIPDPIACRPPFQWKELVQSAKVAALTLRSHGTIRRENQLYACPDVSSNMVNDVRLVTSTETSILRNQLSTPSSSTAPFQLSSQFSIMIREFSLNKEQIRAFTIIALQMSGVHSQPLRMYLGGIGGTGKSQVIKAVTKFLGVRGEEYRQQLCAPTGSAASIIGGSTYHSILGISRDERASSVTKLSKIQSRLARVDLLFLDEVSMVSCLALYRISEQMSNAFDTPLEPFGGKNVVLAGDFGQLPPPGVGQASLYSSSVGTNISARTGNGQRKALGKAVWHMFDTHVMLRENMHQTGVSLEDIQYRRMLTNARLKACDDDDLQVLDRITIGLGKPDDAFGKENFSNHSVITAWNAHRDAINEYRVPRFAQEKGEELHHFYSIDNMTTAREVVYLRQERQQQDNTSRIQTTSDAIPNRLKKLLWELSPCTTEHVPGRLTLCRGLPVMLKSNEATELCATNGAEATVYDWDAYVCDDGREVLKTLFIKIQDPPRDIQIANLPFNVVPITAASERIHCLLPNDTGIWIVRRQVPVLPNFAMTDFACQGRTRPTNPIDIRQCKNHQAIYTCLSRSSSLAGTLILAPFDKRKLTGGPSADLKRELRELEIMDDISKLRFEGHLPEGIKGNTRAQLVRSYQRIFGAYHIPPQIHPALDWRGESLDDIKCQKRDIPWENLSYNARINRKKKRKGTHPPQVSTQPQKKKKTNQTPSTSVGLGVSGHLKGLIWDEENWSCLYDALLTVLWNAHAEFRILDSITEQGGEIPAEIINGFTEIENGVCTLEIVRDRLRTTLNARDPVKFPLGRVLTALDVLFNELIKPPKISPARRGMVYPKSYLHTTFRCSDETASRYRQMSSEDILVRLLRRSPISPDATIVPCPVIALELLPGEVDGVAHLRILADINISLGEIEATLYTEGYTVPWRKSFHREVYL